MRSDQLSKALNEGGKLSDIVGKENVGKFQDKVMCRTSVERRVVKISSIAGEVPTIPASDDHTDGSWIATDVYVGELFLAVHLFQWI